MKPSRFFAFLFFLLLSALCVRSQDAKNFGQPVDMQFVDDLYLIQKKEALKAVDDLTAKYVAALEKCRTEYQTAGNLEGVLESKRAIDAAAAGTLPDGKSTDATVEKFEQVYLKQRAEAEKAAEAALKKVEQDYITMLENLAVKLTKEGKIDEALKAREKLDKARHGQAAAVAKPPATGNAGATVKILSAYFGTGGKYNEVTGKVREMIEEKRESFWADPKIFGGDPNPGWNKETKVKFTKDGVNRQRSWGKHQQIKVEHFYGPQDKDELQRWLVGSRWKADVEVSFDTPQAFSQISRLGNYQWSVQEFEKITMVWSASEVIQGNFNDTWTSFTEQTGKKRTFKKVK